jgi:hypothetical protein
VLRLQPDNRGTDPGNGKRYDEPDIHTVGTDPGDPAGAEVVATAADLDCWLWHRPEYTPVTTSGDPEVLAHFESTIAPASTDTGRVPPSASHLSLSS